MKENLNDDDDFEEEKKEEIINESSNLTGETSPLIQRNNPEEKKSKDSLLNILQNLERDLVLKNNCEKEFDLDINYEEKYLKTEVFGNPYCCVCMSSIKKDSSFQLFHCSHCNNLFCKECLNNHYVSSFQNIKDSYIKYIPTGSNEDIIDKVIPEGAGTCRLIFYIILISLFNFFYLLPIFAMKPILYSLETIIGNCITEVFTHKIEDPDSLFNFYDIFFDEVNTLNLDFDLMMIMNWLGNKILDSCGFIFTIILFIIINLGYFIMLFNFDFIHYNENNKYNGLKFLQLILCYIMIFIGIGGSSLLSQNLFLELFNKYKNITKKENEDKIFNNDNEQDNNDRNRSEALFREDDSSNDGNSSNNHNIRNDNELELYIYDISKKIAPKTKSVVRESKIERMEIKKTKLGPFFLITLITLLSFFANFYINLEVLNYKYKVDDKISKEFLLENLNSTNITLTETLYESNKKFFFIIYLSYYFACMIISIIFYLMIQCCCLRKKKKKIEIKKDDRWVLIENPGEIDKAMKEYAQLRQISNPEILKKINEDNTTQSYNICNFCGFFYYSMKTHFRGRYTCCDKCCNCLRDCCVFNCKSFIDCCNITLCQILNIIFCNGREKCNCNCTCCGCDKIVFTKNTERFCFCYQEKRKHKWFHDYITSQVQKDIAPYILEYVLLGLLIITFQKKFYDFKVKIPRLDKSIFDDGITIEDGLQIWNDWNILIIIVISLFIFFMLTRQLSKVKLGEAIKVKKKNVKKTSEDTYSIFNGIHILLLINSMISLAFSISYFGITQDFGDYIIVPLLMYQYFYFSFNYYCIIVTDLENNHDLFLSGDVLVSIYLKIWDIIYSLIINYVEYEQFLYFFQGVLSVVIIAFFIFYLIYSKFKYVICYNCVNINFCGFLQICCPCCKCNTYCIDGIQYCDCCCCDEGSCCYSNNCESYYNCCGCCSCFSEENE